MKSRAFEALSGNCPAASAAPGTLAITVPAFGTLICQAGE
jgi:hypothetical protein